MCKVRNGTFQLVETFEPQNEDPPQIARGSVEKAYHGTKRISSSDPKMWDILTEKSKTSDSLATF